MKKIFLFAVVALMLTACQNEGLTPEMNYTELWPAGVTYEYREHSLDEGELYPDSLLYGYINRKGEMVIQPQFVSAGSFSCGYAPVTILGPEKKYSERKQPAFIDKKGHVHLISGVPDNDLALHVTPFYYNIAKVYGERESSVGGTFSWMVDNNMKVVGETLFPGSLWMMTKDGLAAYLQYNGTYVIMEDGTNDYYADYTISHYNPSGQKVLHMDHVCGDGLGPQFRDGYEVLCFVRDSVSGNARKAYKIYCIVDTKGQIVYEDPHPLTNLGHERFLRTYDTLYSKDQFEVIDKYGNLLGSDLFKAPKWDEEQLFVAMHTRHDRLEKNLYYYINQDGKQTFERSFDQAEPFINGYAVVLIGGSETEGINQHQEIINMKGETVCALDPEETVSSVHNGLILTTRFEHYPDDRHEYIRYNTYKDFSGRVIYSWQFKKLNGRNSAPSNKVKGSMVTPFAEGLYVLGNGEDNE